MDRLHNYCYPKLLALYNRALRLQKFYFVNFDRKNHFSAEFKRTVRKRFLDLSGRELLYT